MAKQIVIMYPDEFEGTDTFTIEFINAHEETYNVEEAETLAEALELIGAENSGEYYADVNDDTAVDEEENADDFTEEDMKKAFGEILDNVFNPKNPNQIELFDDSDLKTLGEHADEDFGPLS